MPPYPKHKDIVTAGQARVQNRHALHNGNHHHGRRSYKRTRNSLGYCLLLPACGAGLVLLLCFLINAWLSLLLLLGLAAFLYLLLAVLSLSDFRQANH